ncbi:ubiquitinyl hydrolase 1 [Ranunculus cassubicifolius]
MLIIEAEISVRDDLGTDTGYVGLVNHGEISSLNSLLQTLYHIPYFRKAVYKIPTMESDTSSRSLPLALQRLFYELQYSRNSVSAEEITTYFEWNTHDVQELNRVLCEKLEDTMKGTLSEGTIKELFEGHQMNFIECINVNYESNRKESFYDLQLDVRDCQDVYASFDKYVSVERLEGENKYHTEEHGLQDAKKGVFFIDFPPVLQLQLKRFEYDFARDTTVKVSFWSTICILMCFNSYLRSFSYYVYQTHTYTWEIHKFYTGIVCLIYESHKIATCRTYSRKIFGFFILQINDRYEFPLELDLDIENGKYLSPDADRSIRNLYTLLR